MAERHLVPLSGVALREGPWEHELAESNLLYRQLLKAHKGKSQVQKDGLEALIKGWMRLVRSSTYTTLQENPDKVLIIVGNTFVRYAKEKDRPLVHGKNTTYKRLESPGMTLDEARTLVMRTGLSGIVFTPDEVMQREGYSTRAIMDRKLVSAQREIIRELEPVDTWKNPDRTEA